jgi:hypothetical protein
VLPEEHMVAVVVAGHVVMVAVVLTAAQVLLVL